MELGSVHSAATSESGRMYEIMEGNPKITVIRKVAILFSHPAESSGGGCPHGDDECGVHGRLQEPNNSTRHIHNRREQ